MKRNYTTFYIVRHGETVYNAKRIMSGHFDSPLTENGIKQAKSLGEKLKNTKIDIVFSSDLLRAQHKSLLLKENFLFRKPIFCEREITAILKEDLIQLIILIDN